MIWIFRVVASITLMQGLKSNCPGNNTNSGRKTPRILFKSPFRTDLNALVRPHVLQLLPICEYMH